MKKSLSILLSICLVLSTIVGCFTFTAAADPEVVNLWDIEEGPNQSTFDNYNANFFSGEFGEGAQGAPNKNYVYGQVSKNDTTPKYSVSPYGWRGYGLAAAPGQRAARYDYTGTPRVNYFHSEKCGFNANFKDGERAVSRQIELEAGKSYSLSFWFKGVADGFDITALDQIYAYHVSANDDSIITSMSSDITTDGKEYSVITSDNDIWEYITVKFTMPKDKSVANFILAESSKCDAAFDDFLLVESEPGGSQEPEEPAPTNYWDVEGAPDQSGMEPYGEGFFSGEGNVERNNYIYGQISKDDTTPRYSVSAYGWRGYGIKNANQNERAARMDNSSGIYCNKNGTAGLMVQLKGAERAVSRQIQLTAGKSYTLSFWYKGRVDGFDIKALDKIYDYHVSDGDSIVTSISADLKGSENAYSDAKGSTWEYVSVTFTMPEDKSVANFILAEGFNNYTEAAFDDFLLVESDPYNPGSEPEEPEDPETPTDSNKWLVKGAPDQSGMEPYGVGFFSGEFTSGGNANYIYGQKNDGSAVYSVSPYGWRGYGLAANTNQKAGRYDYNSTANYAHTGTGGFIVEFKYATRAVSRQIMLEGGKSYYFAFWFFGTTKGFKITALDQIYDTHQSEGENIAIANKDVTSTSAEWSTLGNWTYVEMKFTLPEDKPVANFILAEGDDVAAGFDEFVLLEKDVYVATTSTSVNGLDGYTGGEASLSASIVDKGDEITATATPDEGYEFDGWYVNGAKVSSNPVDTFTVTGDTEYKANFTFVQLYNYIENGDFEKDKQPAQHSKKNVLAKNGLYNTNTEEYDAANVHGGTASYRLTNDSNQGVGNNWWQLQVKEGESYILKFWVKGQQMGLGIGLSDNTDIALPSGWDAVGIMFGVDKIKIAEIKFADFKYDDWTEFTYYIDVPVKSDPDDIMYLDILFATCGHTAYLDDMSLYNLASAVPTVYINGSPVYNNNYVVTNDYTFAQDNVVDVTANTYPGLVFNGWYSIDDLENPISTETTISYTQQYNTPDVVAKFTGIENLVSYAGAERADNSTYNNEFNGWFWTANNGDGDGEGALIGKSISSTEAHSGLQSYKLEYKYNHGLGRTVKLEAGKTYKLTFWYKATATNLSRFLIVNRASDTDKKINDKGATFDSDHLAAYEAANFSLTATEWTQKTVVFNTAEGMDTVDIFFAQSGDNGDAFYIDDISIVEAASQVIYVDNTPEESIVRNIYYTQKPDISISFENPVVADVAGQTIKYKLFEGEEPENYSDLTGTNPFDQVEVTNGTWTLKYYTVDANETTTEVVTKVFRIQDNAETFCEDYTPGDVFADGEELVNADDLFALRRYIAGYTVNGLNTSLDALDVNGDGYINEKDAFILERNIAKWNGYELARGDILN